MSTVSRTHSVITEPGNRFDRWIETAGDWFNPILVKEVRQSLKSRQFVLTFLLLLVGAWLVSFLSIMWGGDAIEFESVGAQVFWWYYLVLSVSMFVIVPFTAFRSLLAERDDNTFDLLSITTLAPRQVVRGKLLSAMVQLLIFFSAVTPFIAFTSMLKGFSWPEVLYVMVLSLLVSVLACMLALMVATLARTRTWQALLSIALLIGLIVLLSFFALFDFPGRHLGIAGMIVGEPMPFEYAAFWWLNGIGVAVGLSYMALFNQIAVARMTFESDNRSTGIRIVCFLQFVLAWFCIGSIWFAVWLGDLIDGWYLVGWLAPYLQAVAVAAQPASIYLGEMLPFFAGLTVTHFLVVGLFVCTEPPELSRRLRRGLPRRRLTRLLVAPWLPGSGRGFLYTLLSLTCLWSIVAGSLFLVDAADAGAIVAAIFDHDAIQYGETLQFATCCCCYVVIYTGLGCLLTQFLLPISSEIRSSHVRIVTILVALVGVLVPYFVRSFGVRALDSYSPWLITVPFDTLIHVRDGRHWANTASILLLTGALFVILLNVRALLRGVAELRNADPVRLARIDAARHVGAEETP